MEYTKLNISDMGWNIYISGGGGGTELKKFILHFANIFEHISLEMKKLKFNSFLSLTIPYFELLISKKTLISGYFKKSAKKLKKIN